MVNTVGGHHHTINEIVQYGEAMASMYGRLFTCILYVMYYSDIPNTQVDLQTENFPS